MTSEKCKRYHFIALIFSLALASALLGGCSTPNPTVTDSSYLIAVNQVGYPSHARKVAVYQSSSAVPLAWKVIASDTNSTVHKGLSQPYGHDIASGQQLHRIDFSELVTQGHYHITIEQQHSVSFSIADSLYLDLANDALAYFYFHRMGTPIEGQYLNNPKHAHTGLHLGDDSLACLNNWCGKDVTLSVKNAWADAGDFGVYPVNHAISAWTLLNAYEFSPDILANKSFDIPEQNNSVPDLLDEVRAGSDFLVGMLPPGQQLAGHKISNHNWSTFSLDIAQENALPRYIQPPSSAATYAVSRVSAQLARNIAAFDKPYAQTQWLAAKDAWRRVNTQPIVLYSDQVQDSPGAGDYPDDHIDDDRYAAAVEMLITAKEMQARGNLIKQEDLESYRQAVMSSPHYLAFDHHGSQSWQQTQGTGSLSLWLHWDKTGLPSEDKKRLQNNILNAAKASLLTQKHSGYPTPINPSLRSPDAPWEWGSNSFVVNHMILLAYAHRISENTKYLEGFYQSLDYLLGTNALSLSFVTGYGTRAEKDTHDRLAWTAHLQGVPYPKGWLSGGPMNDPGTCQNEPSTDRTLPGAIAYAPTNTAPTAWCSKENTVNWNAPFFWVAEFAHRHIQDLNP